MMTEETQPQEEQKEEVQEKAPEVENTSTEETKDVEVPKKFEKIVEEIENMSVLDLHELVKVFEQKFDVSAAAVAVAGPAGGDADAGDSGSVNISLEDVGGEKIQVIKVIKELLGLGLKDAKDFVEAAPKVVKEGIPADEANDIKEKLEAVGAKVAIK